MTDHDFFPCFRRCHGWLAVVGMATLLVAPVTLATDSIDFHVTGTLSSATCAIATKSLDLDLQDVMVSDITPGAGSRWVTGEIVSNGCNGVTDVNMTFAGNESADAPGFFDASGVAGIAVEPQADTGAGFVQVTPGSTYRFDPKTAGQGWPLRARLVSTGKAVSAGKASASITVTIEYS